MKKLLKNVVTFTIGFVLFILIPSLIISTYDNYDKFISVNSNVISLQAKSQYDSLDVLFLGSSHCYSSINPKILDSAGIKCYNLGIATAGVEFYDLIINDYLNNIDKYPRKVFITISPLTFSSASDNFEAYPIHRYLENPVSNFEIAIKYNHWQRLVMMYKKSIKNGGRNIIKGYFVPLIAFISTKYPNSNFSVKKMKSLDNKGFIESSVVFSDSIEQKDKYLYQKFNEEQLNKTIYFDLIKIFQNLMNKGIDVVFIEIPTNRLSNYFNNLFLSDYENLINQLGEHAPVIRLDSNKFEKSNYRNIDHMNNSGAIITTKQIINYLSK